MTAVGFKRLRIGVHTETNKVTPEKIYVVEGKQDEGATVSAEITGLSAEPLKVYGSDIAYLVMQKGVGDVAVNFGILDMLETVSDEILGYKKSVDGFSLIGESTKAPYVSLILESEDLRGNPVMVGFFKGKFSKGDMAFNTKTGEQAEPEPDAFVFSAIADDKDGETKGETAVKYISETKSDDKVKKFRELVIPTGVLPEG